MSTITFLIQGSAPEPYEVVFEKDGQALICSCTCQAAWNNLMCKHRMGILTKKPKGIVSDNPSDLDTVYAWVDASHVSVALHKVKIHEEKVKQLEKALRSTKDELNVAKRKLVGFLNGELPSWAQEGEQSDIS